MKKIIFIVLSALLIGNLFASDPPKREFRAAWIATVTNLDWPLTGPASSQQQEMITMLDNLQGMGINVVIFQIRTECDALYKSEIDPWSYWLTGRQGQAPSPEYDPLEFTLKEAHKRGMELHAWFNPYRVQKTVGSYTTAANHVSKLHPDWTITIGTYQFLDPGLPAAQKYVLDVVMDVVTRYDVDGIHADDYFYPYPPSQITNQDLETYTNYNPQNLSLADWRRENVNMLIASIYDSIQVVKPYVKFGMSPFGIWKSGVPTGIAGLNAYDDIYCDAVAWLQTHTVDYLTPQLYWPFGGGQDYGKLLPWWASQINGRHLYPGQAAYRIPSWYYIDEMPRMIRLNRSTENVYGGVYFRAKAGLIDNPKGFADSLREDYYRYPALLPVMDWKDTQVPNVAQNLRYGPVNDSGPSALVWDLPEVAADGDTAVRYAVYRFADYTPGPDDVNDPKNMLAVVGDRYYFAEVPKPGVSEYSYLVTALDRNYNESAISNIAALGPPLPPVSLDPQNGAQSQRDTVIVKWQHADQYSYYTLQVSVDPNIKSYVKTYDNLTDSSFAVTGLDGQTTYYWQVKVNNAGGASDYGEKFSFTTGYPVVPILATPAPGTKDTPLDTVITWNQTELATAYHVQFATSSSFDEPYLLIDSVMTDTSLRVSDLASYKIYYWQVKALNEYGGSNWSDIWAFRTANIAGIADGRELPLKYGLEQNYPNPFNPTTTIPFSLAQDGFVSLKIYDMRGRVVMILINGDIPAGSHQAEFDASGLPSGVYVYQLTSRDFRMNRKMVLLK